MKRLVIDLNGTITSDVPDRGYADKRPHQELVQKLRAYPDAGFSIIVYTSRNMRSFENAIGKINAHTLPMIILSRRCRSMAGMILAICKHISLPPHRCNHARL